MRLGHHGEAGTSGTYNPDPATTLFPRPHQNRTVYLRKAWMSTSISPSTTRLPGVVHGEVHGEEHWEMHHREEDVAYLPHLAEDARVALSGPLADAQDPAPSVRISLPASNDGRAHRDSDDTRHELPAHRSRTIGVSAAGTRALIRAPPDTAPHGMARHEDGIECNKQADTTSPSMIDAPWPRVSRALQASRCLVTHLPHGHMSLAVPE